jgi:hypothetical protein
MVLISESSMRKGSEIKNVIAIAAKNCYFAGVELFARVEHLLLKNMQFLILL